MLSAQIIILLTDTFTFSSSSDFQFLLLILYFLLLDFLLFNDFLLLDFLLLLLLLFTISSPIWCRLRRALPSSRRRRDRYPQHQQTTYFWKYLSYFAPNCKNTRCCNICYPTKMVPLQNWQFNYLFSSRAGAICLAKS